MLEGWRPFSLMFALIPPSIQFACASLVVRRIVFTVVCCVVLSHNSHPFSTSCFIMPHHHVGPYGVPWCNHGIHLDKGGLHRAHMPQYYGSGRARTPPILSYGPCSISYCYSRTHWHRSSIRRAPCWFDIMTGQDYVKLQAMEAETRKAVVGLFTMASDCARDNHLPKSLAWLSQRTASLIERGGGASDCVEALGSTELLLAELLPLCYDHAIPLESIWVKNTIMATEKWLRDLLVIRAQLTVTFERDAFENAVGLAYGYRVVRGSQLHSQIMHSYRTVIWINIASAFPSNCEKEKEKRGYTRPKRARKSP